MVSMILAPLYEVTREDGYLLSTDRAKLDVTTVHRWLAEESYWAKGRPLAVLEKAIANSLCFGVYRKGHQVAVARVVTDYATFGWLCDVFVDEAARGDGIGKWMVQAIMAHPDLVSMRRIMLATRDAHELYRRYGGFDSLQNSEFWMIRQLA